MNKKRLWLVLALLVSLTITGTIALRTTLAYLAAGSNTIHNTFKIGDMPPEETAVEIRVRKRVDCTGKDKIGPKGFSFLLTGEETGEFYTMTTDEKGVASVLLPFDGDDAGKTYTFELSEINDGRGGVTYDSRVYVIGVSLSVDEQNRMTAQLTMNGSPVEEIEAQFRNVYAPAKLPVTGDSSCLPLYALMLLLSGAGLALLWRNGRTVRRPQ